MSGGQAAAFDVDAATCIEEPDRLVLGFGRPIQWGERIELAARPSSRFRPSALIVSGEARAFYVLRFVSGLFDQLGEAVHGVHFVAMGHAWPVLGRCDVCEPNESIAVEVVNCDTARRPWTFTATIYGRHL
jgi:hypothetical protein